MKNRKMLLLALSLLSLLLSPGETLAQSPGIKIFSGGKVLTTGASTIIINNGDFINNGTFSASGLNMVTFEGITSQAIGGTGATVFSNLTVNNPVNVILNGNIISVSGILLCNGPLIANGNLKLLSTAAGTALISGAGTGEVSGNVTMERYLPSEFGYKYFSSPFQAATVNEFGDDMNLAASFTSFYRYDENRLVGGVPASGWVNYKATVNVLNPMAGYAVNFGNVDAPNTVDVTGVVNNGTLSQTLYNHNNTYTKGFNLVGNPYPSPIDWNALSGWTRTNIDDALYFFKASTTEQYGGTYSTLINGNPSDGLASNIIPSMQGFMVHVTDGPYPVPGVLQMDNNTRITNQSQPFIKGKSITSLLRFTANFTNNPDSPDYSVIYFDPKATSDFDGQLDALKLMNTDISVPSIYVKTPNETKISIKALPYITDTIYIIPLGLKINQPGEIIFKLRDIEGAFTEMNISITDIMEHTQQNLLNSEEYRISLSSGEYNNRFFLNVSNSITGIPDYIPESDFFTIYYSHSILKADFNNLQNGEGTLIIYNLLGRPIYLNKVHGEGYHEFEIYLTDGVYVAALLSGNITTTKKILIIN